MDWRDIISFDSNHPLSYHLLQNQLILVKRLKMLCLLLDIDNQEMTNPEGTELHH